VALAPLSAAFSAPSLRNVGATKGRPGNLNVQPPPAPWLHQFDRFEPLPLDALPVKEVALPRTVVWRSSTSRPGSKQRGNPRQQ
jgi:hypothetical protein